MSNLQPHETHETLTISEMSSDLSVSIIGTEDPRPLGPRVVRRTRNRRFRQQLKVRDRLGSVSHRSTNTVISSIASSDHDHVLAFRLDVISVLELGIEKRFGIELRILSATLIWHPKNN